MWNLVKMAWLLSLLATLGSLFLSEFMGLPPCVLCWYQRIALYPLVVLLAIGVLDRDPRALRYSLPLVFIGSAIAGYHNLVYYHVIPESLAPCTQGVSCATRQIEWLGFISIPLLSLTAFFAIAACLLVFRAQLREVPHGTR